MTGEISGRGDMISWMMQLDGNRYRWRGRGGKVEERSGEGGEDGGRGKMRNEINPRLHLCTNSSPRRRRFR